MHFWRLGEWEQTQNCSAAQALQIGWSSHPNNLERETVPCPNPYFGVREERTSPASRTSRCFDSELMYISLQSHLIFLSFFSHSICFEIKLVCFSHCSSFTLLNCSLDTTCYDWRHSMHCLIDFLFSTPWRTELYTGRLDPEGPSCRISSIHKKYHVDNIRLTW